MNMSSFTQEQLNVINHINGHALVSAVAGSGKTEVLIERTVKMINSGIDPETMLILMFNKSAQEVFLNRLLSKNLAKIPEILTFHALGKRILDIWSNSNRTVTPELIEDTDIWYSCLKNVIFTLNKEGAGLSDHPDQLKKYLESIDILKNMDYPYCSVDYRKLSWNDAFVSQIEKIFPLFELERKNTLCLSLNDLLYDAVLLLRAQPDYAKEWAQSLRHIMVDEYQDSNPLQHWIVDQLLTSDSSLMVVGDEDQCIYAWRAADPDMMVKGFEAKYKNVRRYTLSRTFRYGHSIALMANNVLSQNKIRPDKLVVSGTGKSGHIEVINTNDTFDIIHTLKTLTHDDVVLVREFKHIDDIEIISRLYNIPYKLEGAPLFLYRTTGLVLQMCLGCINNEIYYPSIDEARAWIRWVDPNVSSLFLNNLSNNMHLHGVENSIRYAIDKFSNTESQLKLLIELLIFNGRLRDLHNQLDPIRSLRERLTSFWCRNLTRELPPVPVFVSTLENFYSYTIEQFSSFFINWTEHPNGVLFTSIHRAKGGGWKTVYLPHLEKNVFPIDACEEERRLFYVAITRSKESLIMRAPVDVLRDSLWQYTDFKIPDAYDGPTGAFLFESNPIKSLHYGKIWSSGVKTNDILTGVFRRYEMELFPNELKSSNLWSFL